MNLLHDIYRYPPVFYRILAAEHRKPLGPDEIARRSGLSRSTVQRISSRKKWDGIKIDVAAKFALGCGFELGHLNPKQLKTLEEHGLLSLSHLQVSKNAPLYRRGANGNTKKFLIRVITS